MKTAEIWPVIRETLRDFFEDHAFRHAAALSYYAILSLAPLLLLLLALAGLILDRTAVAAGLVDQMRGLMGESGAQVATTVVEHTQDNGNIVRAIVGFIVLLFAASGVFVQLQDSMNTIWEAKADKAQGLWGFVRSRFLSIGIVLSLGFLLVVSLAVSAALEATHRQLTEAFPGADILGRVLYLVVSLIVFTALFAALFKYVPDVRIPWRSVLVGAFVTAVLFTAGKFLIGFYLGRTTVASAYGAAGSLVLLLIWLYYSSLIVLLGAEFTQVVDQRFGTESSASRNTVHKPATLSSAS